jgi:hypothetical protein
MKVIADLTHQLQMLHLSHVTHAVFLFSNRRITSQRLWCLLECGSLLEMPVCVSIDHGCGAAHSEALIKAE